MKLTQGTTHVTEATQIEFHQHLSNDKRKSTGPISRKALKMTSMNKTRT